MFLTKEFLQHLKEAQYSKKTIKQYSYMLHRLINHCQIRGITDIQSVSIEIIYGFLKEIKNRKCGDREYCMKLSRLRKYFDYLEEIGLIFISPLEDYSTPPKYPKRNFPVLDEKEIGGILKRIKTDHPLRMKGKAIIELAYSSALRPREIYNLKITDIDFKKGLLFIEQSKNQKDRVIPVGKEALLWVEKYVTEVRPRYIKNKTHNFVFISHKTGEKLTIWGIRWAVQETLRLTGMQPIKPYSLRSTAATALLLNGMSIAYISNLLGHSDIRTTQVYLNVKLKDLKKELSQKHPRSNFENYRNNMKEVRKNEV